MSIENNKFDFHKYELLKDKAGSNGPLLCGKQTTFEVLRCV